MNKLYSVLRRKSPIFFLLLILVLSFLPIVSFQFALKNDMFLYYFPPKFLFSEVLKSGILPLWNPYISFGLPFYSDMNSMFWNPITWVIGGTAGYNAYTLTFEALLYIFLAGTGMFALSKEYSDIKIIRLISAASYMCNGFIIGHLQHLNWLSGAAFLPWCLLFFITMFKTGGMKPIILSVISFYMLITSAHPGLIIASAYFFMLYLLHITFQYLKHKTGSNIQKNIKTLFFFTVLLSVLSLGIIFSYLEILPLFTRGSKISLQSSLSNPTTIQSWISVLLPFPSTKNLAFFNTDIAMRNVYFGLVLFTFFLYSLFSLKKTALLFPLFTGFFFATLAGGGLFKELMYKTLPFIGHVRLNGEFRLFAILCFIILSTKALDSFIKTKNFALLSKIILALQFCLPIVLTFSLIYILYERDSILFRYENLTQKASYTVLLKSFVDNISFSDTIAIQSLIQLTLLSFARKALQNGSLNRLLYISAFDLILATLLNLPFTGVGQSSVSEMNRIFQKSPKGIPAPAIKPIVLNDTILPAEKILAGQWNFYNKQIGSSIRVLYPVKLTSTVAYYNEIENDSSLNLAKMPYLFYSSSLNLASKRGELIPILSDENIIDFSPNKITTDFHSNKQGYIIYLQNYYPHWYTLNKEGERAAVKKAGTTFMGAPVEKGYNKITFIFAPKTIICLFYLTSVTLFIYIILLFYFRNKQQPAKES